MTCAPLAATGAELGFGLVVVALAGLVIGVALLLVVRTRRGGMAGSLLLALAVAAGLAIIPAPSAEASSSACESVDNTLTVVQTSTMAGLAPGIAPVAIVGRVTNNGVDSTYITAVQVEITGVTVDGSAVACTAADFTLIDTVMPVGRTLDPGASATFSGAAIGFANAATNQDDCRHAAIHLRYTANPG
ncbi:hypothetical protein [Microbacterium sp. P05]|uniref:hypothetical protein n=1 Tax=Microbacterium sp. P05 TaxID=3366948 RepID=UPI0037456DBF